MTDHVRRAFLGTMLAAPAAMMTAPALAAPPPPPSLDPDTLAQARIELDATVIYTHAAANHPDEAFRSLCAAALEARRLADDVSFRSNAAHDAAILAMPPYPEPLILRRHIMEPHQLLEFSGDHRDHRAVYVQCVDSYAARNGISQHEAWSVILGLFRAWKDERQAVYDRHDVDTLSAATDAAWDAYHEARARVLAYPGDAAAFLLKIYIRDIEWVGVGEPDGTDDALEASRWRAFVADAERALA